MARVRYLGPEPVIVPELGRAVEPDEVVEVPDDRFEGYACQPANWEAVEEPTTHTAVDAEPQPLETKQETGPAATSAKKTAARPQKTEG